ncbi:receptor-like protein kinase [Musa troglodytarum]|uniref:non-specific serine/threonine protein kinase n=1 Tax=Musa troglodytarum TaxID=320322 RepID=A0A9E7G110_9LILI|nr:receptor-like protein kinase [Musa troglodytarum]
MWRSLCLLLSLLASAAAPAAEAAACPLDLTYVSTYTWDDSVCVAAAIATNLSVCCQSLLSVYGIGAAQRLHDTGLFRLPDVATSAACLADLQANLSAAPLSLPSSIVSDCFPSPSRFVTTCAGVYTRANWTARVGNATELDSACDGDLTDLPRCNNCLDAGVVNRYGPKDPRARCMFGFKLLSPSSDHDSSSSHSAAVYASVFAAIALVVASGSIGLFLWLARRKRKKMSDSAAWERSSRLYPRPNTGSICFDIKELDKATASFSQRNLIGRGGFGVVYKGTLSDGSLVAVKKVLEGLDDSDEEFRNEVEIISHLRHRNLVPLRGCCITEEDREEGKQRKTIILDVAKGLVYLHYGVKPAIYHRDIKSTNILLDGEMRARVADFGLARQSREGQSHLTTRIMSGRRALDTSVASNLVLVTDWAWTLIKGGRAGEVLDAALTRNDGDGNSNPKGIMERFVLVGVLCAHVMVALRPTMMEALKMLEGDIELPVIPDRPMPLALAHGSVFGEGNTFTASPALSGPRLNTGDVLR